VGLGWVAAEHWNSAGFLGVSLWCTRQAKELLEQLVFFCFLSSQESYPRHIDAGLQYTHSDSLFQKELIHFFILMLCNFAVDIRLPMLYKSHAFFYLLSLKQASTNRSIHIQS
jgi:hypothetical protein